MTSANNSKKSQRSSKGDLTTGRTVLCQPPSAIEHVTSRDMGADDFNFARWVQMDLKEESSEAYEMLKRRILRETGLDCAKYKEKYFKRRIVARMRARGAETCKDYSRILGQDPSERELFLDNITINVTHFFRDSEAFRLLEEEIIPLIIYRKVKRRRRVIRLWSAGCASGEETYSLAILLMELLGDELPNFLVSITGSDIDAESLKRAENAIYEVQQMENVKPEYLNKYFDFFSGKYYVKKEVKELVKFKHLDLFSDKKAGHHDAIFCRNVVMYFTREMQNKLLMEFYDSLNDDGYLILGKTEMLVGDARNNFSIVNARERVYQKTAVGNS